MTPLPLPVRLAAGILATAVEQARDLPRLAIEFPVTAVSQALQASMRVQQKVTELAIKGDRVLGSLRPVEESPSWATFDDDEPRAPVTELRPAQPRTAQAIPVVRTPRPPDALPEYVGLSIPQLRGKLSSLSAAQLAELLEWEQANDARPPYVTMLANRISTVSEG